VKYFEFTFSALLTVAIAPIIPTILKCASRQYHAG